MDASFLYSEDGGSHNDIGMVLLMDGPALTKDEMIQAVADRIALVPRFRQRLRHVPYAAALPVWIDDVTFDLARHITMHETPDDADHPDPIGSAVSHVMSGVMDLSLPLWQINVFQDLPEGRWLIVVRMHHAMVDGVSSTEIVHTLLSTDPAGEPAVPDDWTPAPEPSGTQLLAAAVSDAGQAAAALYGSMRTPPAAPTAPSELVDIRPILTPGIAISPTAINGPIEAERSWGMTEVELARIKRVRAQLGGTFNDIILAACAHGLSTFMAARGESVRGRMLRAMVPVSLRSPGAPDGPAAGGNDIGGMVIELPLGEISEMARVERIHEQTQAFKKLMAAMPAQQINPGSALLSPLTLILGTRMAAQAPTIVNTVITNVPGPQTALYLRGRKMHRLGACIALWSPLRIAISVLSYNGMATIGVVTDSSTFPDARPLLDAIEAGLKALDTTPSPSA